MSEDVHRELGAHDAKIDVLEKEVHLLRQEVGKLYEKLDEINTTLATAKGGWRTMMLIGGAISGTVVLIHQVITWIFGK